MQKYAVKLLFRAVNRYFRAVDFQEVNVLIFFFL